jgi:hypothetical protein
MATQNDIDIDTLKLRVRSLELALAGIVVPTPALPTRLVATPWTAWTMSGGVQGPNSVYDPAVWTSVIPAGTDWVDVLITQTLLPSVRGQTIAGMIDLYIGGGLFGSSRYHNNGIDGNFAVTVKGVYTGGQANPEVRIRNRTDAGSGNCTNTVSYAVASPFGR